MLGFAIQWWVKHGLSEQWGSCCRLSEIPTKSEIMLVRTDGKSCSRELVEGRSSMHLGLMWQEPGADLCAVCSLWVPQLCAPQQPAAAIGLEGAAKDVRPMVLCS